jgi:hypothetical protein
MLRKVCPNLAVKVHRTQEKESHPWKKEWRPEPIKADGAASARTNMVFVLPPKFYAPNRKELLVAQLDFGPRPVIFEKPREKNYKHLKALYLKGYINGNPVNKMLVDIGATINIMPYSVLHRLGHCAEDLIKTNVTLSDFNGQALEVLNAKCSDELGKADPCSQPPKIKCGILKTKYHIVVTSTRGPAPAVGHTSVVMFQVLMSMIRWLIWMIIQNSFCHVLHLFAAIWQMTGS